MVFKYVDSELDPWHAGYVMRYKGFLLLSWFVFLANVTSFHCISDVRFLAKTLSRVLLVEFSPLPSALREDLLDILLSAM